MDIIKAEVLGFKKIAIVVDDFTKFSFPRFIVKNDDKALKINSYSIQNYLINFYLEDEVNIKKDSIIFYDESINRKCTYYKLFSSEEFNGRFFTMDELGVIYNKNWSEFRVWSPPAAYVNLLLYANGDPEITEIPRKIPMEENKGLWTVTVNENLKNYFYTYEVMAYDNIKEAVDPYAKAVGINGLRGAVIDLDETNPEGFNVDVSPCNTDNYTDAIIYEINVRDMTMNPNSGAVNRGKFLGLTEENTKTIQNKSTAIDYIKELGITHVQIMPMFDYSANSVDEKNITKYNWGYDPENYNVPEGSYSTNPFIPECRILETKAMIQAFHKKGICVNMDVVFNHLYHHTENCFEKIFPGYYLRRNDQGNFSNGSGCNNDTASENPMMRRFIADSVLYWVKEYHLDGFRFDLMGIHDVDTMNIIRHKLDDINPKIMLYGEGWDLNTALPKEKKAQLSNCFKTPRIGYFNDFIRDTLKGSNFNVKDKGYISGKEDLEEKVKCCVNGSIKDSSHESGIFLSPEQSVNYVSCHDNNVLWDKLILTDDKESEEIRINRVKLALGIILTSQGIPFMQSGVEFIRTKQCIENTYNCPDNVNWIDWDRKDNYIYISDYVKGLIRIRKTHPAFRLTASKDVMAHLEFLDNIPKNSIGFLLKGNANGDIYKNILVLYNPNYYPVQINLPAGNWNLIADKYVVNENIINFFTSSFNMESQCINILYNSTENFPLNK